MSRKILSITHRVVLGLAFAGGVLGAAGCELDWAGKAETPPAVDDPVHACTSNTDCPEGYCDPLYQNGVCVDTTGCNVDANCEWGQVCDTRGVCVERPICSGDADCATGTHCETHLGEGYPGVCFPGAPAVVCSALTDETSCLAETSCGAVYTGIDCTNPDGTGCDISAAGCTCASFTFASCVAR